MRRTCIAALILGITCLTSSPTAWVMYTDFEYPAASGENPHNGAKSSKYSWQLQSYSPGTAVPHQGVPHGGEMWGRAYWYFKSPWSWSSYHVDNPGWTECAGGSHSPVSVGKMLRFHRKTATGGNGAYVSIYKKGSGEPRMDVEGSSTGVNKHQNVGSPVALPLDKWVCMEMYCKFLTSGGVIRMWIDGQLVLEYTDQVTMNDDTHVVGRTLVWTYWNCGAPQAQVAYVDDLVLTNDTPADRDSQGNPMIGPDAQGPWIVTSGELGTRALLPGANGNGILFDIAGRRLTQSRHLSFGVPTVDVTDSPALMIR